MRHRRRAPADRQASPPAAPSMDMPGLEDEIRFALRLAQIAVFEDVIETLSPFSLRPSSFSALRVIAANPGLKQQDVGRDLGIKGPNLVGLIEDLHNRKLITRKVIPGDRRSKALSLTLTGRGLLEQAEEAHRDHQARIRAALGDKDPVQFLTSLHSLARMNRESGD